MAGPVITASSSSRKLPSPCVTKLARCGRSLALFEERPLRAADEFRMVPRQTLRILEFVATEQELVGAPAAHPRRRRSGEEARGQIHQPLVAMRLVTHENRSDEPVVREEEALTSWSVRSDNQTALFELPDRSLWQAGEVF